MVDLNEKLDGVLVRSNETDTSSDDFEKKVDDVRVTTVTDEEKMRVAERLATAGKDVEDVLNGSAAEFILEKLQQMTVDESLVILREALDYHDDDLNFPTETFEKIKLLLQGQEASQMDADTYELDLKLEATLMKYHSPYPEVRAICDPTDDPTLPAETIRAYFLGILWVAVGGFINEFFSLRQPSLSLQSAVLQILLYPCGKFLQYTLPDWGFTFRGTRHSLNPGPWTYKEQMFATIMVNVASGGSNFMGYVVTLKLDMFFGQKWVSFGFMFLMNFSTQFFGFGLAGMLRRWCVYPTKAVWPTVLPTLALNRALLVRDDKRPVHGWSMSKYKFFFIVFTASFLYFFIPSFLFMALSVFNWITWISPKNTVLAIVTGSYLGLGFNPLTTFDWSVINYSAPLVAPFFSTLNRYVGTIIGGLLMLGLYWKNYKWTGYLPINSSNVYDHTASLYNLTKVVKPDSTLDEAKYKLYSPPYISVGNLLNNGSSFALYTLAFTYMLLTDWKLLSEAFRGFWKGIKNRKSSNYEMYKDPMSKMMSVYPEVPDWWFVAVFLISIVFGIVAFTVYPTGAPVWGMIVIVIISTVIMVPSALIYSVTGYQLFTSTLSTLIAGYMIPNNGIANMMCRVYGYNTDEQAEGFVSDQKMAHYAKLPPRAVFRGQMVATLIQTFVTVGAIQFLINSVSDLCSPTQASHFVCTFPHSLYSASLLFGVVGPVRTFNQLYPVLKYSFIIGVGAAFPIYGLRRLFPRKMKYVHPVLILTGVTRWGSSYNLSYYTPGMYMSFIFMFFIRRRYLSWWTKYNYILTSGLSAGVAFSGILIFCALTLPKAHLTWWGNTVSTAGIDGARKAALFTLPKGATFGLPAGSFE
ncbi:OPT oligopeptide transporter protein-domain-containing protein [Lipomyces chichibuensis]|uniref:OPT oligopeptide transporter protein-domain-containing protein n=1 Tax=Lipomyces chichibuensis TaxID=1546026 RepID=UPI003343C2E0